MAKKRTRKKRMTITARYNRLASGLSYFGYETPTKKRATSKSLKALQKIYKQIRKSLKDEGNIDLPTIAQASAFVKAQDQEITSQQTDEREPLPYAPETVTAPINVAQDRLDDFLSLIDTVSQAVLAENAGIKYNEKNFNHFITQTLAIKEMIMKLDDNIKDKIATMLVSSNYYQRLQELIYLSYEEVFTELDSLQANLSAIINEVLEDFVAPTDINFDNI